MMTNDRTHPIHMTVKKPTTALESRYIAAMRRYMSKMLTGPEKVLRVTRAAIKVWQSPTVATIRIVHECNFFGCNFSGAITCF